MTYTLTLDGVLVGIDDLLDGLVADGLLAYEDPDSEAGRRAPERSLRAALAAAHPYDLTEAEESRIFGIPSERELLGLSDDIKSSRRMVSDSDTTPDEFALPTSQSPTRFVGPVGGGSSRPSPVGPITETKRPRLVKRNEYSTETN